MSSFAAYTAEKARRGKSYKAQVIETLWLMLFFCISFAAGALTVGACK